MMFADVLRFARRGAGERKVQQELDALLRAIESAKKPGSLTITLKVTPSKNGENEMSVDIDATHKPPKVPLPTATFFLQDGKLSRTDPRQMDAFDDETDRTGVTSLDTKRLDAMGAALAAG